MSKRRGQADNQSQSPGKRPRPAPKKNLYLVLDDWDKGYSIRKIDPDTMLRRGSNDSSRTDRDPVRLPEPAAFRFVAPALDTQFLAIGSNVVVVSSGGETEAPTLVYDTAAAALAVGPPLPGHLAGLIVAVAADGDDAALYALTTLGAGMPLAFEAFSWAPCTRDTDEPWLRRHEWSWKSVAAPPPPPPLASWEHVVSHAVHPDGRTVFVSTRGAAFDAEVTYSFDAERREWTRHGAWALPFRGQGHFDRELDAWVGLDEKPGYVCACQVASRSTDSVVPPESDRTEKKLFFAGDEGTLTYMGDSKFCLVESLPREDEDGCDGRMVRVTMFGLKFDRKGKLQTTSHRTTSSYVAPKYVPSFSPVAFWM